VMAVIIVERAERRAAKGFLQPGFTLQNGCLWRQHARQSFARIIRAGLEFSGIVACQGQGLGRPVWLRPRAAPPLAIYQLCSYY